MRWSLVNLSDIHIILVWTKKDEVFLYFWKQNRYINSIITVHILFG